MDEESKQLLRQLVDAQKEQTELLRKHVLPLWTRIRFSLLALLVLMTLMATGIGFTMVALRSSSAAAPATPRTATVFSTPTGDSLRITGTLRGPFLEVAPSAPLSEGPATAKSIPWPDFSED